MRVIVVMFAVSLSSQSLSQDGPSSNLFDLATPASVVTPPPAAVSARGGVGHRSHFKTSDLVRAPTEGDLLLSASFESDDNLTESPDSVDNTPDAAPLPEDSFEALTQVWGFGIAEDLAASRHVHWPVLALVALSSSAYDISYEEGRKIIDTVRSAGGEALGMEVLLAKLAVEIKEDVARTEPVELRSRLQEILEAYAIRNPKVGFCQGMTYILSTILHFGLSNSDAFLVLAALVEVVNVDYYTADGSSGNLLGIRSDLQRLSGLVTQIFPSISDFLNRFNIPLEMVLVGHVMTLTIHTFPDDSAARAIDIALTHGKKGLFAVYLALVQVAIGPVAAKYLPPEPEADEHYWFTSLRSALGLAGPVRKRPSSDTANALMEVQSAMEIKDVDRIDAVFRLAALYLTEFSRVIEIAIKSPISLRGSKGL